MKKWTPSLVEEEIRLLVKQLGRVPLWDEAWRRKAALTMAAYRTHGGWRLAVEAAGFSYPGNHKYRIKKFRRKDPASMAEVALGADFSRKREGFAALLKEKGLWDKGPTDPHLIQILRKKGWMTTGRLSREAILAFIKELSDLGYNTNLKKNGWLVKAAKREFGSWGKAVLSAGREYHFHFPGGRRRQIRYSARSLLTRLKELNEKPARLRTEEERKELQRLQSAAYYHFGSTSWKVLSSLLPS